VNDALLPYHALSPDLFASVKHKLTLYTNTVKMYIIHSFPHVDFGYCDYEITQTNTGSYTWNETEGSNKVLQGCALGPAIGIAVEDALAERDCNMFGEWERPDIDDCITIVTRQFLDLQESIITVSILLLFLQHNNHICHPTFASYVRALRGNTTGSVLQNCI